MGAGAGWGAGVGDDRVETAVPRGVVEEAVRDRWVVAGSLGQVEAGVLIEGVSESASVRKVDCFVGYFMSFRARCSTTRGSTRTLPATVTKRTSTSPTGCPAATFWCRPQAKCEHFKTQTARMPAFNCSG